MSSVENFRAKRKAKGWNEEEDDWLDSDDCEIEDESVKVNRVWRPAEGVIVSDPDFYEDVVTEFLQHKSTSKNKDLYERIRKHLLYLGWKIEYFKEDYNMTRMRYTSPGGRIYMSLVKVCEAIFSAYYGTPSTKAVTERPKEESKRRNVTRQATNSSSDPVFEPEYCPEAIENWCKYANSKGRNGGELNSLKAKKHLSAMGWTFTYFYKVGKRELRYWSPRGKGYNSLCTACKACIQDNGTLPQQPRFSVRNNQADEEKGKEIESEGGEKLNPAARPSKRVREAASRYPGQTTLSWLIDHNAVVPGALVQYISKKSGPPLKEGHAFREGIRCKCCDGVFALSAFEAHAGSSAHRPSTYIYLEDGRSLRECQQQMLDKAI